MASVVLCGLSGHVRADNNTARKPITVFVANKIITMDPGWTTGTAVAVRDGKILSVGSLTELKPWLDSAPYTIDRRFENKVLMPGFVEAHGHPILGGILLNLPLLTYLPTVRPYGPIFPGVKTRQEAEALMRKYVLEARDPHQTVFIWGWDVVAMGGRHLDKTILDRIAPSQPLIVWDASEHFIYANSAEMKKVGVTDDAFKVNGVMAGADGHLNGQFLGTTAARVILRHEFSPLLAPEYALPRLRSLLDLSVKGGITTQSELALGLQDYATEEKLYRARFSQADAPTRCVVVCDGVSAARLRKEKAIEFIRGLEQSSTDYLIFKGVKFFSDDSFVGLGMVMDPPGYIDGHKGIFILQPGNEIRDAMMPWWKAGFHIHIHSNGSGGNASTIEALSEMQAAYPRIDHRFTIEHFGESTPEMARRVKALGAVVSINPYYVYYRGELNAPFMGTDLAYTASRLRSALAAGLTVSLHSDTPIGPPRPLEWAWIAVNRFGQDGKVLGPDERVSVAQALRMITIDAAYTLGVEDKVGSIEAGKFADFTVLDQDPFAVRPEKLRDIHVWGTVIGGRPQPADAIRPPAALANPN